MKASGTGAFRYVALVGLPTSVPRRDTSRSTQDRRGDVRERRPDHWRSQTARPRPPRIQHRRCRYALPGVGQAHQRRGDASRRSRDERRPAVPGISRCRRRCDRSLSCSGWKVPLLMGRCTIIRPIGRSFWRKLDGAVDAGFRLHAIERCRAAEFQFRYRVSQTLASKARLTASLTVTKRMTTQDAMIGGRSKLSYLRYPWREWFITAAARFETNESLGLTLRSQIAVRHRSAPHQQQSCVSCARRRPGRE